MHRFLGTAGSGTVADAPDTYLLRTQRDASRALLYEHASSLAMKLIWFVPLILYGAWSAFLRSAASGKPSLAPASNWLGALPIEEPSRFSATPLLFWWRVRSAVGDLAQEPKALGAQANLRTG